jgi:hypothetical protein
MLILTNRNVFTKEAKNFQTPDQNSKNQVNPNQQRRFYYKEAKNFKSPLLIGNLKNKEIHVIHVQKQDKYSFLFHVNHVKHTKKQQVLFF